MELQKKIKPSLLVAEMFFPLSHEDKNIVDVVEKAGDIEFYKAVETGVILDKNLSNRLRKICENSKKQLTQWATFVVNNEELNMASIDPELRQKSVNRLKELIHIAADCGADTFALTSGGDPGAEKREEAKLCLADSLKILSDEAKKYSMSVMLEHLDRYVHKKQLMGPVDETAVWIKSIRKSSSNMYLSWDAAHAALGGEDLVYTLQQYSSIIPQIHLSNAILDPAKPFYGDYHIKFGPPGFLTLDVATKLLATAINAPKCEGKDDLRVSIEMRTSDKDTLWQNEQEARDFLQKAITRASSSNAAEFN